MRNTTTQNAPKCAIGIKFSRMQGNLTRFADSRDHELAQSIPSSASTCATHPLVEAGSTSELPENIVMDLSQPQSTPSSTPTW